jgi:hypothetical protein
MNWPARSCSPPDSELCCQSLPQRNVEGVCGKKQTALVRGRSRTTAKTKSVAFDGLDHARHWTGCFETAAHLLEHDVRRIPSLGSVGGLADNLDDLIAALLELLEQVRRRLCSRLLGRWALSDLERSVC